MQRKMEFCYYKKIAKLIIISIIIGIVSPLSIYADRVLWPSIMNLENEAMTLMNSIPETATSSGSKKGFLFVGDPNDIFTLGAGHIAINVTLSGAGHTFFQHLRELKSRGIKITMILCNDRAPVGVDLRNAPKYYDKPYFYMMDFNAENGEWQKYNFDRIVEDYGDIIDNWILGNEINSQVYNYYGPADINEYTKVYCDTFKICYDKIKSKNENADVYISFDQGWDLPEQRKNDPRFNKKVGLYRYNAKEMIAKINANLPKSVDWGLALHPYPAPVESAKFWDDEYAGYDERAHYEKERPYLITLKNFEVAIEYLGRPAFLRTDGTIRNVIISEFGLTSHDGERVQAAALYYLWEKIKDNDYIKCFLYNALTDLDDYNFGLVSNKNKKRLAWAVFKDMDREYESAWCKDLLDEVLDENDYVDFNTYLFTKASFSELTKGK